MEKASIDSKEGAFSPRSIRLKKSIEISRTSANCSWVIPLRLRIERSFLPNCFRKVATLEVCFRRFGKYTEYDYGFAERQTLLPFLLTRVQQRCCLYVLND
jgi:hypothetical protein